MLEEVEAAAPRSASAVGPTPLVVRGPYGFGRVTVVGARRRPEAVLRLATTALFWVKALDLRRPSADGRRRPDRRRGGSTRTAARPVDPALAGARAVPGRQADPVRLGGLLHLPLHPADRAGRLLLPQEGAQADGADLDHLPADRGDGEPAGLLRGLRGQGARAAGQQGGRRRRRPGPAGPGAGHDAWADAVQPAEPRLRRVGSSRCRSTATLRRPSAATPPPRPPAGTEVAAELVRRARAGLRRHGRQRPDQLLGRRLRLRSRSGEAERLDGRPRSRSGAPRASPARWFGPAPAPAGRGRPRPGRAPTAWRARSPTARTSRCTTRSSPSAGRSTSLGDDRPGRDGPGRAAASDRQLSGYLQAKSGPTSPRADYSRQHAGHAASTGPTCCSAMMFHDSVATSADEHRSPSNAAPRPRPDRPARARPADAGGPDRPARPPGSASATPRHPPKIDQTTLLRVILPLKQPSRGPSRDATSDADPTADRRRRRPIDRSRRASTRPMIETHDLTKMYGDLYALNRLNLTLNQGDVYGFIGPNGAGKTTTMRILATLLNPTWGEATVCGYSIYTGAKEIRRVDRLHARLLRRLRRHEGHRVPRVLRRRLPDQGPGAEEDLRGGARAGRPDLQARRPGHQPLARHDPAARPGPRPAARPAGAAARRARLGPRPPRPDRDPGAAQGAADDGQDDPGLQPHPARAGRHLQQDRDHRAGRACWSTARSST